MAPHEDHTTVGRGFCFAHLFHLLLGAAKASLFPFLTLYFRQLGLPATQLGMVLGVKAIMWMWCAPTWTACAKWCNKKKFVLAFSLLMLAFSSMLLTFVPPADPELPTAFCMKSANSSGFDSWFGDTSDTQVQSSNNATQGSEDNSTVALDVAVLDVGMGGGRTSSSPPTVKDYSPGVTVSSSLATSPPPPSATTTKQDSIDNAWNYYSTYDNQQEEEGSSFYDNLSEDDLMRLLESLDIKENDIDDLTEDQIQKLLTAAISAQGPYVPPSVPPKHHRQKRTLTLNSLSNLKDQLGLPQSHETFVFVIALILVGELFSAPVDKLADDIWFEYLDIIDALERYGSHRAWATLGLMVVAPVVGILVNIGPCLILHDMPRFFIHFFIFAGLMLFVFVCSIAYPVSQNKKTPKRTRLGKGLRIICADTHAFSLGLTIFLSGAVTAMLQAFLWWRVQDLGGSETIVGVAVGAAAFSELLIFPLRRWLIKHISNAGAIALGLTVTAGRLIFYSFMWSPWLVVGGELLHGLCVPLIWSAVETYPDFRINPFVMDRSALSVLNSLYLGLGAAGGVMLAGFIYDTFDFSILMQGTAIFIGTWCLVFLGLCCCIKKQQKLRYAKLLQDERSPDSDDDDNTIYEDDWLEIAMERDR